MSEHREWDYNHIGASLDRAKEHNATVRAYRDAMAECDRLGKANGEACDRIHALEKWKQETLDENNRLDHELDEARQAIKALESRPVLTWEECEAKLKGLGYDLASRDFNPHLYFIDWLKSRLPAPTDSIRVPFSDEQIEALARVLEASADMGFDADGDGLYADWDAQARAAFAHIGAGAPIANEPNADIVLAGLEERDEPVHAHMLDEYIRGYCEANSTIPSSVSYSRTGFRYALEAMRKMLEPAAAETLEQLAEIGFLASYHSAPPNHGHTWAALPDPVKQDYRTQTAAILRAAQAYVDCKWTELCDAANYDLDGNKEWSWTRAINFANSRIRYRVALPETPKWLPDIDHLEALFDNTYGATKSDKKALEAVVTELRPWLREPTGWELDVTADEAFAAWRQHESPDYKLSMQAVLDLCRSRIRPTFECAECAKVKAERDAFCRSWDDCRNRLCVIRNLCDQAALEGE